MTQSLIMLVFLLLYPYVTGKDELAGLTKLSLSPVTALFAAFFGGQIGSRLIPMERLGFWQNMSTPNGRNLTILSKTIIGLIFVTVFSALVGIIHFVTGRITDPIVILFMIGFAWVGLSMGLPLGIFFANFSWEHPRRMLKGGGAFLYALLMMFSGFGLYGLVYLVSRFLSGFISPIIFMLLVSCGFLAISLAISLLKLANMEWNPEN